MGWRACRISEGRRRAESKLCLGPVWSVAGEWRMGLKREASSLGFNEKVEPGPQEGGVAMRTVASVGMATWKDVPENVLIYLTSHAVSFS